MKTDFADIKEKVFDLSDKVVLLTTEVAVIKNDLSCLRQSPQSSYVKIKKQGMQNKVWTVINWRGVMSYIKCPI